MEYLKIKNWDEYQHYTNRNPPWIKLYNTLLDDYDYGCLQDDSKLLLMSLFLLASRTNNRIPNDLAWIKSKAMLRKTPNPQPLINIGFLEVEQGANKVIAQSKQTDSNMIERAEERRERGERETETDYSSNFLKFWKAYPRKEGKGGAFRAWKRVNGSSSLLPEMIKVIERQKETEQWQQDNGKYIPHPATWLNQRRWEDEIKTEEEEQQDEWRKFREGLQQDGKMV